jgi:hypothetical protein
MKRLEDEAKTRQLRHAWINCSGRMYLNYLAIMREVPDGLGAEHFAGARQGFPAP